MRTSFGTFMFRGRCVVGNRFPGIHDTYYVLNGLGRWGPQQRCPKSVFGAEWQNGRRAELAKSNSATQAGIGILAEYAVHHGSTLCTVHTVQVQYI
jgi:hypothetical protein